MNGNLDFLDTRLNTVPSLCFLILSSYCVLPLRKFTFMSAALPVTKNSAFQDLLKLGSPQGLIQKKGDSLWVGFDSYPCGMNAELSTQKEVPQDQHLQGGPHVLVFMRPVPCASQSTSVWFVFKALAFNLLFSISALKGHFSLQPPPPRDSQRWNSSVHTQL